MAFLLVSQKNLKSHMPDNLMRDKKAATSAMERSALKSWAFFWGITNLPLKITRTGVLISFGNLIAP